MRCVLLVGHNKGWEEAASDFTGERVSLRVANAALIECASDDGRRVSDLGEGVRQLRSRGVDPERRGDARPSGPGPGLRGGGRATGARRGRGTTGPGTRLGEKVRPSPRRALLFFRGTREKEWTLCVSPCVARRRSRDDADPTRGSFRARENKGVDAEASKRGVTGACTCTVTPRRRKNQTSVVFTFALPYASPGSYRTHDLMVAT